jgi:hypothetical protein
MVIGRAGEVVIAAEYSVLADGKARRKSLQWRRRIKSADGRPQILRGLSSKNLDIRDLESPGPACGPVPSSRSD